MPHGAGEEGTGTIPVAMGGETEYGMHVRIPGRSIVQSNAELADLIVASYPSSIGEPSSYAALIAADVPQRWDRVPEFDAAYETPDRDLLGRPLRLHAEDGDDVPPFVVDAARDGSAPLDLSEAMRRLVRERRAQGGSTNRFLPTGDRLYVDHLHPELSFPEVLTARDAVRYQKASQLRMNIARSNAQEALRSLDLDDADLHNLELSLYGNNHDFGGHAFGTHENYLLPRSVEPFGLIRAVMPFFVSRIAFAGLGTLGPSMDRNEFTISQRALFAFQETGLQTTYDRPIVNTRDEPHATRSSFIRHHVIIGDSNHAEWALYLKFGLTALLMRMVSEGGLDTERFALHDPLSALRTWSADWRMEKEVRLASGAKVTAPEHLAMYLDDMLSFTARRGESAEEHDLLEKFGFVIDRLKDDPQLLYGYLDWPTHLRLLMDASERSGAGQQDTRLKNISLRYADIDPAKGLYHKLAGKGHMRRIVSDEEILDAFLLPPADTRASLRGQAIAKFGPALSHVSWDSLRAGPDCLLLDPFEGTRSQVSTIITEAATPQELFAALRAAGIGQRREDHEPSIPYADSTRHERRWLPTRWCRAADPVYRDHPGD